MANDDIPVQYSLMGESTSVWLIVILLLVGSMGSIASVNLLVPKDLTVATIQAWFAKTGPAWLNEHLSGSDNSSASITGKTTVSDAGRDAPGEIDDSSQAMPSGSSVSAPGTESSRVIPGRHITAQAVPESVEQATTESVPTEARILPGVSAESQVGGSIAGDRASAAKSDVSGDRTVAMDLASVTTPMRRTMPDDKSFSTSVDGEYEQDCPPILIYFRREGVRPIDQDLSIKINRLQAWLSDHPDAKLIIEGHTDSYGAEEWNLLISHRRAKMVEKILASVGVPQSQMSVRALGEYSPLDGVPPESGKNRRVSLRVTDTNACPTDHNSGDKP